MVTPFKSAHHFEMKHAVQMFMTAKGKPVSEFDNFAFLTDVSSHLNDLNFKFQSKDQLVDA